MILDVFPKAAQKNRNRGLLLQYAQKPHAKKTQRQWKYVVMHWKNTFYSFFDLIYHQYSFFTAHTILLSATNITKLSHNVKNCIWSKHLRLSTTPTAYYRNYPKTSATKPLCIFLLRKQ